MGVIEIMGWRRAQWAEAFADQGREFCSELWRRAYVEAFTTTGPTPTLGYFDEVQAAWCERHVYDPLKSPIVLAETYRARAAC